MKKNIKTLGILLLPLFLFGCNATYTIDVSESQIKEQLILDGQGFIYRDSSWKPTSIELKELFDEYHFYTSQRVLDELEGICDAAEQDQDDEDKLKRCLDIMEYSKKFYYNQKLETKNQDSYSAYYDYTFKNIDKYKDSGFLSFAKSSQVSETSEFITINSRSLKTLSIFDDYTIDNLKVKIKTKLDVVGNNADKIEGNTYIWNITKDNKDTKTINITIQKETEKVIKNKKTNKLIVYTLIIFIPVTIAVAIYIALKVYYSNK